MKHPIYHGTKVRVVVPYTLTIEFNDGLLQTINFQPVLVGEIFGPLRELSVFNAVKIDPEVQTLVWPNGADICPDVLYSAATGKPICMSDASAPT